MSQIAELSSRLHQQLTHAGVQLYFLRHGHSMANHAGSIVGWTDSKLSVKGENNPTNSSAPSIRTSMPSLQSTPQISPAVKTLSTWP